MVIGVVVAGIAGDVFGTRADGFALEVFSPATMINTFERVNGEHPGFRRNHAKGVCVSGYFESNGRGAALSKAGVFCRVVCRYSDGLRSGAGSLMWLTRRIPCEAWHCCLSCRMGKSGAPA